MHGLLSLDISIWASFYLYKMLTRAHCDAVEVPIYWRLVSSEIFILFNCRSKEKQAAVEIIDQSRNAHDDCISVQW